MRSVQFIWDATAVSAYLARKLARAGQLGQVRGDVVSRLLARLGNISHCAVQLRICLVAGVADWRACTRAFMPAHLRGHAHGQPVSSPPLLTSPHAEKQKYAGRGQAPDALPLVWSFRLSASLLKPSFSCSWSPARAHHGGAHLRRDRRQACRAATHAIQSHAGSREPVLKKTLGRLVASLFWAGAPSLSESKLTSAKAADICTVPRRLVLAVPWHAA